MSHSVRQFIDQMQCPQSMEMNAEARATYERGLDATLLYAGDERDLMAALEIFHACGSQPYCCAGTAAVLMFAAYESGNNFNKSILKEAESWLGRVSGAAAERPEIAFLHAQLALIRRDQTKARQLLDRLLQTAPDDFFVRKTELWYWYNQRDLAKCEHWFQQTMEAAETETRQRIALTAMAGCYAECGNPAQAIQVYEKLTKLEPDNPWHWHNLSVAYFNAGQRAKAKECNQRVLAIADMPIAEQWRQVMESDSRPWKHIAAGVVSMAVGFVIFAGGQRQAVPEDHFVSGLIFLLLFGGVGLALVVYGVRRYLQMRSEAQ